MGLRVEVVPASATAVRLKYARAKKAVPKGMSAGITAAAIYTVSVFKREILSGQVVRRVSGNLSRSMFSRKVSDLVAVLGFGREAPYAKWVNDGTDPHVIRSKNGKALAFTPSGVSHAISAFAAPKQVKQLMSENRVFRSEVHHPGTKPTNFAEIGLRAATPGIVKIVNAYVDKAMGEVKAAT